MQLKDGDNLLDLLKHLLLNYKTRTHLELYSELMILETQFTVVIQVHHGRERLTNSSVQTLSTPHISQVAQSVSSSHMQLLVGMQEKSLI